MEQALEGQTGEVVDLFSGRRATGEPRLKKAELARTFGFSTKTIERWMHDERYRRDGRQVPFEKPYANGGVRFVLSEVQAWLRS